MTNFREFIVKQCFYPDALAVRPEDYAKVGLSEILLVLEKKYKANFGGLQYDQYNEICYIEIYGEHNCKIRWDLARPFFQQFIGNQTSIAKLLGYDESFFQLRAAKDKDFASNCCGTSIIENTDLCSHCKKHCEAELLPNVIIDI